MGLNGPLTSSGTSETPRHQLIRVVAIEIFYAPYIDAAGLHQSLHSFPQLRPLVLRSSWQPQSMAVALAVVVVSQPGAPIIRHSSLEPRGNLKQPFASNRKYKTNPPSGGTSPTRRRSHFLQRWHPRINRLDYNLGTCSSFGANLQLRMNENACGEATSTPIQSLPRSGSLGFKFGLTTDIWRLVGRFISISTHLRRVWRTRSLTSASIRSSPQLKPS